MAKAWDFISWMTLSPPPLPATELSGHMGIFLASAGWIHNMVTCVEFPAGGGMWWEHW